MTPRLYHALIERWQIKTDRAWLMSGTIAATIANVNRDSKKRAEPFSAFDFTPVKQPAPSDAQVEANLEAFFAQFNVHKQPVVQ